MTRAAVRCFLIIRRASVGKTGHDILEVDPDTADGADTCRAYDIVEYPTLIALSDDGRLQNMWRGRPLPTISEVSFYV